MSATDHDLSDGEGPIGHCCRDRGTATPGCRSRYKRGNVMTPEQLTELIEFEKSIQ